MIKNHAAATPGIRHFREAGQINQRQFAQLIGVNLRTLQNWDQHRTNPSGTVKASLKIEASFTETIGALYG